MQRTTRRAGEQSGCNAVGNTEFHRSGAASTTMFAAMQFQHHSRVLRVHAREFGLLMAFGEIPVGGFQPRDRMREYFHRGFPSFYQLIPLGAGHGFTPDATVTIECRSRDQHRTSTRGFDSWENDRFRANNRGGRCAVREQDRRIRILLSRRPPKAEACNIPTLTYCPGIPSASRRHQRIPGSLPQTARRVADAPGRASVRVLPRIPRPPS